MEGSYSGTGRYPPGSETTPSGDAAERVQEESHRLAEKVKAEGQSMLADQQKMAADEVGGVADALRRVSQEMHRQERPPLITPYAERTADSLERFSGTLRERDFNTLIRQAEDFARRQPGVFVGGAVVTGFLLARFLRSSAPQDEMGDSTPFRASTDPVRGPESVEVPSSSAPNPTTPPTETATRPKELGES